MKTSPKHKKPVAISEPEEVKEIRQEDCLHESAEQLVDDITPKPDPIPDNSKVEIVFRPVCQCGHILPKLRMVYETREYQGDVFPVFMMFDPERCPNCKRLIGMVSQPQPQLIGNNIVIFMEENK